MKKHTEQIPIIVESFFVFHNNREAARQTIDEIFRQQQYKVEINNLFPIIIDGGSHIGIATLFFKSKFPNAKISCFEPDKAAFAMLQKNMTANHIKDVQLFNMALANSEDEIDFFGQMDKHPDIRGNSIFEDWGKQNIYAKQTKVQSTRLSSYINEPIDLLKLDIEGAEQLVLQELGDKLKLIQQLLIEIHETDQLKKINNLETIIKTLEKYHFEFSVQYLKDDSVWNFSTLDWVEREHPKLFFIHAKNLNFELNNGKNST